MNQDMLLFKFLGVCNLIFAQLTKVKINQVWTLFLKFMEILFLKGVKLKACQIITQNSRVLKSNSLRKFSMENQINMINLKFLKHILLEFHPYFCMTL